MKNNRIIITKSNNQLHFYLKSNQGSVHLFSQKFSKGVHDYFRFGRSDNELYKYCKWGRNPRLDHTIEKCLSTSYRRSALEENFIA